MSESRLARFTLLPDLKIDAVLKAGANLMLIKAHKSSSFEVCTRCATPSSRVYDRRIVEITDAPLRNKQVRLRISKRRFECPACKKVFTEPIAGITKGKRFTHRFKAHVLWACERFSDLKAVKHHVGCSYGFIYKSLYEQLELQRRRHAHPQWPRVIGIDEHSFRRNKKYGYTDFVTMVVDHRNRRMIELVNGKSIVDLKSSLSQIPKPSNVHWVTMDLSPTFRSFAQQFFPRCQIVADKFHVVRLLDNHINRTRKQLIGDKRKNPIRKLLLKNSHKLDYWKRSAIMKWLDQYPELRELYLYKQALHRLYRIKGYNRARTALKKLVDRMASSKLKQIRTLRRTLIKWFAEIANYFKTGLTNARVEGFNNKAKLIKRKAYGYRSFKNYRLRVLNACC